MPAAELEEVVPGILLARCPLPPDWGIDVAVIAAQGMQLAVIDTGVAEYMPTALEPALAALGASLRQVHLIVNTHGHWDHVQGNAAIQQASGATVAIPAEDAALLPSPPDRLLHNGDTIDLGGLVFDVVATPGHSAGFASLFERAHRLLIVSDAVQGYGLPNSALPLYFHSGRQYRASLERLLELDVELLVLGHPFQWGGPAGFIQRGQDARAILSESLKAARAVERVVQQALDRCPDASPECLRASIPQLLLNEDGFHPDPGQPLDRLSWGSVRSELRDLGISTTS